MLSVRTEDRCDLAIWARPQAVYLASQDVVLSDSFVTHLSPGARVCSYDVT